MSQPVTRALISVSDKTGLLDLARGLAKLGIEIISTGGTARTLKEAGIGALDVSDVTGFPEIMDGRVKTLHPKIHGALLAVRGNAEHEAARKAHDIGEIGLLVVNLYPFEETVAKGAGWDETIENIDIGGPAMIRAASKNHNSVTVVVDPQDYAAVLRELESGKNETSRELRRKLAAKAYARTAAYDAVISQWFGRELKLEAPDYFATGGKLIQTLRYGENPHQTAALYAAPEARAGITSAKLLQGKELSYNNINDTDAALECLAEFRDGPACVIVKHANPCGVATGATLLDAYKKAFACDTVSAFGGIVALNGFLDEATAKEITGIFTEVIAVADVTPEAAAIIAAKKNLRLLVTPLADPRAEGITVKTVAGGLLVQSRDDAVVDDMELKTVTKRQPTPAELADLRFAFRVAKHVKSNAIVYAKDGATVGIGAGQMSRVDSSRIAASKGGDAIKGSVVASDAFFPFPDGLLAAASAGATAVIQPGGSLKDADVITAADAAGLAMVFTGIRHFRH
ncbi:MAG: bifunctional phosphoribosylaminoimidazolecarboxamide formyltransferase/IMP cyclohydrolase [Aestuariivirga sp.]